MVEALAAMPKMEVMEVTPGAWCAHLPIWDCLLMQAPGERTALTVALLRWAHVRVELAEGLRPVRVLAHLVREHCWMVRTVREGGPALFVNFRMAHRFNMAPALCVGLREAMDVLLEAVPLAWRAAALAEVDRGLTDAAAGEAGAVADAERRVVGALGWRLRGRFYTLSEYKVRLGAALAQRHKEEQATASDDAALLTNPNCVRLRRRPDLLADFYALAGGALVVPRTRAVLMVEGVLTRLRKSKWDNFSKTHFWELVLDGHPTAERLHNAEECGCGAARGAGRAHVFWDCGGAGGAVVEALEGELTGVWTPVAAPSGAFRREHLWLARRPTRALHAGVWELVRMAAVPGMRAGSNWMTSHQDVLGGGRVAVQKMWEARPARA